MSRTPAKERRAESTQRNSPFDVDLGGTQRDELRSQRDGLQGDVARLQEEQRLKDMQIEVLRKLQKQETRTARVEKWSMSIVIPVFSAWCRATSAARVPRAVARLEQEAEESRALHGEKEVQVSALIDRIAAVKANAHSKLSGLSEANRKLAAALERKDKELVEAEALTKHLRRAARKQGEQEVELQLQLDACREELGRSQNALEATASASLTGQLSLKGQLAAESDRARSGGAQASTLLEALRAADARLLYLDGRVAELEAHCDRQAAYASGLQAETACLKAESAAERTLNQIGVGGHQQMSSDALPLSALELEVGRWRRALLIAVFWGWRDRVSFQKELVAERGRNVLVVSLPEGLGSVDSALLTEALLGSQLNPDPDPTHQEDEVGVAAHELVSSVIELAVADASLAADGGEGLLPLALADTELAARTSSTSVNTPIS